MHTYMYVCMHAEESMRLYKKWNCSWVFFCLPCCFT